MSEPNAKHVHQQIEKQLKEDQKAHKHELKLLLLGSGESGQFFFFPFFFFFLFFFFFFLEVDRGETVMMAKYGV